MENDFGKSESQLLEYYLSKSLKVAGTYWSIESNSTSKKYM